VSLYFLDSSALVKRYVTETGSNWIRALTDPTARNPLIIARITWVEVLSALARREREGSITSDDVARAIRTFSYDLDTQYQVAEVDGALARAAGELVIQHPLRAYDAVQLASAHRVQSDLTRTESTSLTFLTADERLIAIAQAEGLLTDNPNHHP
jgi:predicted nucleic acid-binding protein